jgi:GNAT superfamily N-acetyltransferase
MTDQALVRTTLRAGDLGRIVELHGIAYDALPGFGLRFEAFVGQTIAEFVLDNKAEGRIWLAERDGRLVGCTAIALRDGGRGQLRWVLVAPSERGGGLGKKQVAGARRNCRHQDCNSVFLETTDGLKESQTLYEQLGFDVTSDAVADLWDGPRPLIVMEHRLA